MTKNKNTSAVAGMAITVVVSAAVLAAVGWPAYRDYRQKAEVYDRWKAFVDILPDSVLIVDKNGIVIDQNRSSAKMFGPEMTGRSMMTAIADESVRDSHVKHVSGNGPMGSRRANVSTADGVVQCDVEVIGTYVDGSRHWLVFISRRTAESGPMLNLGSRHISDLHAVTSPGL